MLRIATNLLAIYKNEIAPSRMDFEELSPGEVVKTAISEFYWRIKDKGLTVDFVDSIPGDGKINADRLAIRRLLVNLIDNAIKFTNRN
ncbi:hypothetical protein ABTK20_20260, partial [Acinetobacter baumannii]